MGNRFFGIPDQQLEGSCPSSYPGCSAHSECAADEPLGTWDGLGARTWGMRGCGCGCCCCGRRRLGGFTKWYDMWHVLFFFVDNQVEISKHPATTIQVRKIQPQEGTKKQRCGVQVSTWQSGGGLAGGFIPNLWSNCAVHSQGLKCAHWLKFLMLSSQSKLLLKRHIPIYGQLWVFLELCDFCYDFCSHIIIILWEMRFSSAFRYTVSKVSSCFKVSLLLAISSMLNRTRLELQVPKTFGKHIRRPDQISLGQALCCLPPAQVQER